MPDSPYPYSTANEAGLVAAISAERFQTYLDHVGGDRKAGLQLYMWNAAVAARLHGPLHLLQVTLRNAVHERLTQRHGANWFDIDGILARPELESVSATREHLQRRGSATSPGKVVADLNFQFWVALFASKYNNLWKSDLGKLFIPRIDRDHLHPELDRLRTLRNRVAHHEPIMQRDLVADLTRIETILTSLSAPMLDWHRWHHRFLDAFGTRPEDVSSF